MIHDTRKAHNWPRTRDSFPRLAAVVCMCSFAFQFRSAGKDLLHVDGGLAQRLLLEVRVDVGGGKKTHFVPSVPQSVTQAAECKSTRAQNLCLLHKKQRCIHSEYTAFLELQTYFDTICTYHRPFVERYEESLKDAHSNSKEELCNSSRGEITAPVFRPLLQLYSAKKSPLSLRLLFVIPYCGCSKHTEILVPLSVALSNAT